MSRCILPFLDFFAQPCPARPTSQPGGAPQKDASLPRTARRSGAAVELLRCQRLGPDRRHHRRQHGRRSKHHQPDGPDHFTLCPDRRE